MKNAAAIPAIILNWRFALGAIAASLLVLFAIGLQRDPSFIPSALIGRDVPHFSVPVLEKTDVIQVASFAGKPLVINFWASWCTSCRQEHSELIWLGNLARENSEFAMLGINSRDQNPDALQFLNTYGQFPYASGVDSNGRVGIDFGIYGMPETFFIDSGGIVRWRHTGPLTRQALADNLPKIGVSP